MQLTHAIRQAIANSMEGGDKFGDAIEAMRSRDTGFLRALYTCTVFSPIALLGKIKLSKSNSTAVTLEALIDVVSYGTHCVRNAI